MKHFGHVEVTTTENGKMSWCALLPKTGNIAHLFLITGKYIAQRPICDERIIPEKEATDADFICQCCFDRSMELAKNNRLS